MAKTIDYAAINTRFTVKPTQTEFLNSCEKSVTLNYNVGSDVIGAGKTIKTSKEIVSINLGATNLYVQTGPSYTVTAGQSATLTSSKAGTLTMTIA